MLSAFDIYEENVRQSPGMQCCRKFGTGNMLILIVLENRIRKHAVGISDNEGNLKRVPDGERHEQGFLPLRCHLDRSEDLPEIPVPGHNGAASVFLRIVSELHRSALNRWIPGKSK